MAVEASKEMQAWVDQVFTREALAALEPPTSDDVTILTDGRRIETRADALALGAELGYR